MSYIDTIYNLDQTESILLFSNNIDQQTIEVREYNNLRWLQLEGNAIQSIIKTNSPDVLLNPVNQAMMASLCFPETINKTLNLGFGGGSIERFFWSQFPEVNVSSVESNEIIIHLAREFFNIPVEFPVYNTTAEQFLQSTTEEHYDLILCDIFENESHPDCLYQDDFYHNATQKLKQNGVLSINLTPSDEQDLLQILLPLRRAFPSTRLYTLPGHYNVIVFASQTILSPDNVNQVWVNKIDSIDGMRVRSILSSLQTLPNPA